MSQHDDFAFEPSPGIPAPLPPGEHILWQGKPDWRVLARRPFHARTVGFWFVALATFEIVRTLVTDATLGTALPGIARTLVLGAVAVGILVLIAWLTGRVTIYTITSHRVLIRFGIALQVTMNLPFAEVLGADVRQGANGVGDIPIQVKSTRRVGYAVLWPHVRPWRISRPEPMLRAVPDVDLAAAILVKAMHRSLGTAQTAPRAGSSSAPATAPAPAASSSTTNARSDERDDVALNVGVSA